MKFQFIQIDDTDNSRFLVEAAIGNYSAIKYASEIEYIVSMYAEIIAGLRCLKANTDSISSADPESLGYERYDDKIYIGVIESLFHNASIYCDDNHLNDQDYINIANFKYRNKYDRCAIVKSSLVSDFMDEKVKHSYKVVVRRGVYIDQATEYSFKELYDMVKSRDILIISFYSAEAFDDTNCQEERISSGKLGKLKRNEWLQFVKESDNPFHSEYMAYLKQSITDELINESINACICGCQKLFEHPKIEQIFDRVKSDDYNDDNEVFKGMSTNQRLSFVKQYEQSNDLINKSRAIFENYSSEYKIIFS